MLGPDRTAEKLSACTRGSALKHGSEARQRPAFEESLRADAYAGLWLFCRIVILQARGSCAGPLSSSSAPSLTSSTPCRRHETKKGQVVQKANARVPTHLQVQGTVPNNRPQ